MKAILLSIWFLVVPLGPSGFFNAPVGPGSQLPIGPGLAPSGSPPPPTCTNSLNFAQACNSQYVSVLGIM
jgi:hypothetical protein